MGTPREFEAALRPPFLDEYVGQDRVREHLQIVIAAAKQRGDPLDHVLLHGPSGLGKTTLAFVIANEMGVAVRATSGSAIAKSGDLVGIVTNLAAHEVLFVDEIHRMPPAMVELLLPTLDDNEIDIVIGSGTAAARTVKMRLERFTLIGETARPELLPAALRSRFGIVHRLEPYSPTDLVEIVNRAARLLAVPIDTSAALEIAQHSRGTPGTAVRLLRRIRDVAQVRGDGTISHGVALDALKLFDVDEEESQSQRLGTPREPISDEVRIFVWQRDRGGCVKCGSQEPLEFDHIIPLAKGGSNTARNLQLLCESCNRQKGTAI